MARSTARPRLVTALLLAGLAVGATACDTTGEVPLPAPVSVPSVPSGAPVPAPDQDDDGYVAPPPAGGQEDGDDGPDDGPADGPDDGPDDDG
jgi:hypothetical protein